MSNSQKIILDLCGGTGSWSLPYKKAGYDVRLVTLPENDVLTYDPPAGVYGILAAPPCTEFSLAKGARHRDFDSAMQVVQACMFIVWKCRLQGSLKFWALENPIGFLRQFLGRPYFSYEQWQFGADHIKPTDLWGYFKCPRPTVRDRPDGLEVRYKGGHSNGRLWAKPECPIEFKHLNLDRAAIRAITPPGFAQAFFEANQ